jgi:UDP-glucose 4-epimerase
LKILITGSRGFVGGTIGRAASRAGHEVLGISRAAQSAPDWPGKHATTDVVSADLAPLVRYFAPDVIFHAAGTASVKSSFETPIEDLRASLLSWANVLDSARRSRLHPLILYPSSGAVYGRLEQVPVDEDSKLEPISPYGFHKVACELLAREYATCFEQRILLLRMFSVFGPAQRRLLIWELFQQFKGADQTVWLQGTGDETRDYLSGDDMARAALLLMESLTSATGSQAINIASGEETRVLDLAKTIGGMIAPQKEIRCRGLHFAGDPERWQADISRLTKLIPSWKPQPLEAGLAECVAAWR